MRLVPHVRRFTLAGLAMAALLAPAAAQEPRSTAPNALTAQERTQPGWQGMHTSFLERAKQGDVGLLFIGDSITQGWGGAPKVWGRFYGPRKAANFGIGGDQTGHLLWRIDHDELKGISPKAVVLMIGTNNLGQDKDGDIAAGIEAVVKAIRAKLPEAKVLLLGVFPRAEKPEAGERGRLKAINEQISKLDDDKAVHYLDIGKAFLDEDGTISKEIMPDFLHLSSKGYRRWADAIEPTLWKLVDEK